MRPFGPSLTEIKQIESTYASHWSLLAIARGEMEPSQLEEDYAVYRQV